MLLKHLLESSELEGLRTIPAVDEIIPIPDRVTRLQYRGFSPARMIAKRVQRVQPNAVVSNQLFWRRSTRTQQGLTRCQRASNVQGAFGAKPVTGRRVLVVDDVYTTGQTINSAARALKKAGAIEVHAFVLSYRSDNSTDRRHFF